MLPVARLSPSPHHLRTLVNELLDPTAPKAGAVAYGRFSDAKVREYTADFLTTVRARPPRYSLADAATVIHLREHVLDKALRVMGKDTSPKEEIAKAQFVLRDYVHAVHSLKYPKVLQTARAQANGAARKPAKPAASSTEISQAPNIQEVMPTAALRNPEKRSKHLITTPKNLSPDDVDRRLEHLRDKVEQYRFMIDAERDPIEKRKLEMSMNRGFGQAIALQENLSRLRGESSTVEQRRRIDALQTKAQAVQKRAVEVIAPQRPRPPVPAEPLMPLAAMDNCSSACSEASSLRPPARVSLVQPVVPKAATPAKPEKFREKVNAKCKKAATSIGRVFGIKKSKDAAAKQA